MFKELKNAKISLVLFLSFMYVGVSFAVPKIRKANGFAEGTTGGGNNVQVVPKRGITGGGNAAPTVATSMAELSALASGNAPAVIVVDGMMSGVLSIGSNKTIVGANSNSGMKGFSSSGSNIIIQNLNFGPSGGDVAELAGAKKVFVTKCEFHDCGDELFSMVKGCDLITISWCKFYFNKTHEHAFAHLIGASNGDKGNYRTTFHHNWYTKGVVERMPRVRFGKVHIYNNYYESDRTNYVIGVGANANILLEATYFKDQGNQAWFDWRQGNPATMQWTDDNKFVNTPIPTFIKNGQAFKPPYEYRHLMYPTEDIPKIVMAGAGNKHTEDPATPLYKSRTTPQKNNSMDLVTYNSTSSKLEFILDGKHDIRIALYDITGRMVKTVLNHSMSAGPHSILLNQSELSNGVYYLKFQANSMSQVIKVYNY